MAKRGPMDMYLEKQTFSNLNGFDSEESDAESSEELAVKGNRSSFLRKYDAAYLHFGFIATDDTSVSKPQCVVCGVVLSNDSVKPSQLKRHLHSKHKEISTTPKEFLERKRGELKCAQKKIYALTLINTKALCASYNVALRIPKAKKPYKDREISVKDCIHDICLEVLGEAAAATVAKVLLSSDTIARRVADLDENMENQLIIQIKLAKYNSLQLDESTNISNMTILMVYVRYEYESELKEEFLFSAALPQRTTGLQTTFPLSCAAARPREAAQLA